MRRKPEERFFRKPKKIGSNLYPAMERDFCSVNGTKLRIEGRQGKRAILMLPSGTATVFVVRRTKDHAGAFKNIVRREIVPDTPKKGGTFEAVTSEELFILQQEFPVLRQFGWPI